MYDNLMKEGKNESGEWRGGSSHLDPALKSELIKSEVEGGMLVEKIPVGKTLIIQTQNTTYLFEHRSDGYYISGNEKYCPEPTHVELIGSKFEGSSYKPNFIGRGLFLEFKVKKFDRPVITSEIIEIFMLDDGSSDTEDSTK